MNDKTSKFALDYILANWFDGDDSPRYCVDGDDEHMVMKKAAEALEEVIKNEKKAAKELIRCLETWETSRSDYCDDYHEGWNDGLDLAIQFVKQKFGIKEGEDV